MMSYRHKRGHAAVGCHNRPIGLRPSLTCVSTFACTSSEMDASSRCGPSSPSVEVANDADDGAFSSMW